MSTTMPTPTDLTRQQLDELDALLQRMLSLPLNAPPAAPVPPIPVAPAPSIRLPAGWRSDPAPAPRASHLADADDPFEPAMAVSLEASARAFAQTTDAMPSAGPLRGVDAPALPMGYHPPADPTPPPVEVEYADTVPLTEAAAEPASTRSRVPVPLWPVFAVNWLLELGLGLTGPVGAVATHPAMKHLLGVTGILLIAAAGAWSARGMGWVSW